MKEKNNSQAVMMVALFLILSIPVQAQSFSRRAVSQTPYDPYMGAVRTVASQNAGSGQLTMEKVQELAEKANDIRYDHIEAYRARSPSEVESSGRGDCKDKALWLYSQLAAAGAHNMQLVIGKMDSRAEEFHAWLYLTFNGRTYLIDPTVSGSVSEVSDFGTEEYIPVYSYDSHGSYAYESAAAGQTFDPRYQTPILAVAGR